MYKNNVFKLKTIFLTIVLIIIIWIVSILLKEYFIFNRNSKIKVKDYEIYYTVDSVLDEYINNLGAIFNNELNDDCFTFSSYISKDKIREILEKYEINVYSYEINLKEVYDMGFDTYRCEYELVYSSEVGGDYYIENVSEEYRKKSPVTYNNEVILKLNRNKGKYKVLYNKFDLGGEYYEK